MRNRCNNQNGQDWKRYGGRGIRVCARWNVYKNFAVDMGPHPGRGWILEREHNDRDYCYGNCCWASRKVQARNRGAYNKVDMALAERIRQAYIPGITRQVDVAAAFGVSQVDVSQITRNVRWARETGVEDAT